MEIVFDAYKAYKSLSCPTVTALGNFDGVHIGHMAIIRRAVSLAEANGCKASVFCFASGIVGGSGQGKFLTDDAEKLRILEASGVALVVMPPFSQTLKSLSPEKFVNDILVTSLHANHAVCGFNYSFGSMGAGNAHLLSALCEKRGVGVDVIPAVSFGASTVSSTRLRAAVSDGDLRLAEELLGRPYSLPGSVDFSDDLAVFRARDGFLLPASGDYHVDCISNNSSVPAILHIRDSFMQISGGAAPGNVRIEFASKRLP